MILIYNNNKIMSMIMERERNPNASYSTFIEIDEILSNRPTIIKLLSSQDNLDRFSVTGSKLYENNIEIVLNIDTDKAQIRSEYQSAQNTLQAIVDATSPTNAQVVAAVKAIARILKLVLRYFARNI